MAKPQPPPASWKKTANPTTAATTGTRSSLSKNLASSDKNNNIATNSMRLSPWGATVNQQQILQQQKGRYSSKAHQLQRQPPPQQLSNYNGKDSIQYKNDPNASERLLKKRRLSKPYRSRETINDSESEEDEPQERDRLGGLGSTMEVQDRARRVLAACYETTEVQDEDGTDTDDFQARYMVRNRRHEYGQGYSSSNNNNSNINTTATIKRDLSKISPYPEHLSSTPPDRSLRPSALTRGTTNSPSPQHYTVKPAPSRKRPPSKVPSPSSDSPRVPDLRATPRKPKVEEQEGENGPLRLSHSLPLGGPPHEADVYKAMEDHGTNLWKEWCKSMHYDDKDQVTPIKLKDYIDFEVLPKDREMMRKSWRLPGHPGFIAVSGLEAYIRPVVRLWCEQSLQAELEAIRDAKLRTARSQQQQQPLRPPPPNLQPRQAKPKPKSKPKLRQSQLQSPMKSTLVSSKRQPMNTASTTTATTDRAEGRKEGNDSVEHGDTETHDSRRTAGQEKSDETKDDDQDNTNSNSDNRDGISGDHTTCNITESDDRATDRDDDQDNTTTRGVSMATAISSKLVASSTLTLPSTSSLPATASTPNKSPPTPPSSPPLVRESQIRAKDIQLLKLLDLASPSVDHGSKDRTMKHRLNPRVKTIANVLTEWTVGVEGGPSIQKMNSIYGLNWQYSDEKKEYSDREAIVREFKRLVVENGKSDEDAQGLLEGELTSSSKADLVKRLRNSKEARFSSLMAG